MSLKKRQTFEELVQENRRELMNDEAWLLKFEEKLEKRKLKTRSQS
jgi:hypothetical protein